MSAPFPDTPTISDSAAEKSCAGNTADGFRNGVSRAHQRLADEGERKVQASVARRLRAPPETAKPQDLSFGLGAALSGDGHRSTVVVGNCTFRADNGGILPGES
jgi:hypothetical protein